MGRANAAHFEADPRRSVDKIKKIWIPQALAGVMLVWAMNLANSYEYYILLRVVCCAVCAYLALAASATDKIHWTWTLGVSAVVYNPFLCIHLTREIWSVANVITIVILAVSIAQIERKERG